MTKNEFLAELENALLENMGPADAVSHLRYYSEYIDEEMRKGKSEEEVISMLPPPRIVAKNIVDNGKFSKGTSNSAWKENSVNTDRYYRNRNSSGDGKLRFAINGKPVNGLVAAIIGILLVVLLLAVVAIIGGIVVIIFKIVLPVAIVLGAMYVIKKILTDSR